MSINLTSTYAPSGAFCPNPHFWTPGSYAPAAEAAAAGAAGFRIYNPGVLACYRDSFSTQEIETKAITLLTQCEKIPIIEQAQLDVYGATCVQLSKDLHSLDSHLRLGPLRGAARPCLLLNTMNSGSVFYTFFDYKAGCQPQKANRVKEELYPIIAAADPQDAIYRIQVVDTAVGGYGINALKQYLWEIKDSYTQFRNQKWELDFRIIHATDDRTDIGNIERVKSNSQAGVFECSLNRYVVDDLIMDDCEGASGFEVETSNGRHLLKQSYKPGRFLLKSPDGARLVQSAALVTTFDELFSKSITEEMTTSPDLKQVGVVWQDYELKG
jgi:hypothetical protein